MDFRFSDFRFSRSGPLPPKNLPYLPMDRRPVGEIHRIIFFKVQPYYSCVTTVIFLRCCHPRVERDEPDALKPQPDSILALSIRITSSRPKFSPTLDEIYERRQKRFLPPGMHVMRLRSVD
jgi:hypothetical protein